LPAFPVDLEAFLSFASAFELAFLLVFLSAFAIVTGVDCGSVEVADALVVRGKLLLKSQEGGVDMEILFIAGS
jgi:hypothetical protein